MIPEKLKKALLCVALRNPDMDVAIAGSEIARVNSTKHIMFYGGRLLYSDSIVALDMIDIYNLIVGAVKISTDPIVEFSRETCVIGKTGCYLARTDLDVLQKELCDSNSDLIARLIFSEYYPADLSGFTRRQKLALVVSLAALSRDVGDKFYKSDRFRASLRSCLEQVDDECLVVFWRVLSMTLAIRLSRCEEFNPFVKRVIKCAKQVRRNR